MATKFGEGYYEIYPRLNVSAVNTAREAIAKGMGEEFARTNEKMRRESANTRTSVSRDNDTIANSARRSFGSMLKDETSLSSLRTRFSRQHVREMHDANKATEGFFHSLATKFRTLGTVSRGLTLGAGVLASWNILRGLVGAVQLAARLFVGALVAAPAVVAGIASEFVILKIAFHGVGTAIKDAFDPKKAKQYQEELKKLAPAARSFVKEIAQIKNIKLPNLQQAFFGQRSVQKAGQQFGGLVRNVAPGAANVAASSGNLFGTLGKALTGAQSIKTFNSLFKEMSRTIQFATPGLEKFVRGILSLIKHVSDFDKGGLGKKIGDLLGRIGDYLGRIDVKDKFDKAGDAAHKLWDALNSIWSVVSGILKAMDGVGAFNGFSLLLKGIADWVNSGTGQSFLKTLNSVLTTLSSLASGLIGNALSILAGALVNLQPALKPLADVISKFGDDLVPLGPLVGTLASAVAEVLTPALQIIEPIFSDVVDAIGSLANQGWFKKLAVGVLAAAAAWYVLDAALALSGWSEIAFAIGLVVVAVVELQKHWDSIWKAIKDTWSKVYNFITHGLGQLTLFLYLPVGAAIYLYNHWDRIWKTMKDVVRDSWNVIYGIFRGVKNFFTKTVPDWFLKFRDWVVYAYNSVVNNTHKWYSNVVNFFTGTVKKFFVSTIPGWFLKYRDWVVYVYNSIINNTHKWWSNIVNFFSGTVRKFFVSTVPGWFLKFRDWVVYAYNSVVNNTHKWWSAIANFFTGNVKGFFTKTIPDWIRKLRDWFTYYFGKIGDGVKSLVNNIKNFFTKNLKDFFMKTIPGWAKGMKDAILTTWDSIKNWTIDKWIKIYNGIRDVVQTVIDAVWKNGLQKAWNFIVSKIPKVGKNLTINVGTIPRWGPHGLGKAQGGILRGHGGPTQDNLPIMASVGEFIVNAKGTKKHRALIEAINDDGLGKRRFAKGGIAVPAIEALQRYVGPALAVTSTTGGGHAAHSYHYRGEAVDFSSGSKRAMDAAAYNLMKFSGYILELIHSPSWFVKNYRKTGKATYAGVYNEHFNHVHLAMTKAAAEQALKDAKAHKITGFVGGGPGGMALLDPFVKQLHQQGAMKQFDAAYAALKNVGNPIGGEWGGSHKAIAKNPLDAATSQVNSVVAEIVAQAQAAAAAMAGAGSSPSNINAGSGKARGWITAASKFANIPASWVNDLIYIMGRESGFNPRAINKSDINAKRGIPSQGLMQLIPPNFRAYHAKGTSGSIFDPIANIAAAVNYIHHRYGTVFNTPWIKKTGTYYSQGGLVPTLFDKGGWLPPKSMTLAANNTSSYERVGGGMPEKIVIDLGNNHTITAMMDDRIAKHDDDVIRYIATR